MECDLYLSRFGAWDGALLRSDAVAMWVSNTGETCVFCACVIVTDVNSDRVGKNVRELHETCVRTTEAHFLKVQFFWSHLYAFLILVLVLPVLDRYRRRSHAGEATYRICICTLCIFFMIFIKRKRIDKIEFYAIF